VKKENVFSKMSRAQGMAFIIDLLNGSKAARDW